MCDCQQQYKQCKHCKYPVPEDMMSTENPDFCIMCGTSPLRCEVCDKPVWEMEEKTTYLCPICGLHVCEDCSEYCERCGQHVCKEDFDVLNVDDEVCRTCASCIRDMEDASCCDMCETPEEATETEGLFTCSICGLSVCWDCSEYCEQCDARVCKDDFDVEEELCESCKEFNAENESSHMGDGD